MDGHLDLIITKNVPGDPQYTFPITDGTMWEETIVSSTTGPFGDGQTTTTSAYEVVGWGNLITPAGIAPALMMTKSRTQDSVFLSTTITFLTNEAMEASILLNSQGSVLVGSYSTWTSTGSTAVDELPTPSFRLESNFPNPFNEATRINFELDRPGEARLRVFDIRGQEVAAVLNESLPAGRHSAKFEAGELASGVYFYELRVDGVASSRKFMILR